MLRTCKKWRFCVLVILTKTNVQAWSTSKRLEQHKVSLVHFFWFVGGEGLGGVLLFLVLQSWRPATEVPKPRPDKSAEKSASESAGPEQGAEESAEKMLQASSLCAVSTEARSPKHFFGTFLGTPFGAGTFCTFLPEASALL